MNGTGRIISLHPMFLFLALGVVVSTIGFLATPYYQLSLLPGLLLLLLILLLHYPQVGFYIIIFLVPFSAYTNVLEGYNFLTISKVVGLWISIVVLFLFILTKERPDSMSSNLWPWLLLFFTANVLSSFLSPYTLPSLNSLKRIFIAFTFFALTLFFANRKRFTTTLPALFVTGVSLSAFLSIIGYVFNISFFAINVGSEYVKRSVGGSHDPNYFASFIIFSLPFLAHWFFTSKKNYVKVLSITLFFHNIIAIILTYSRAGALAMVLVLLLLAYEHAKKFRPKHLAFFLFFTFFCVVSAFALIPDSYWERQRSVTDIKTDSSMGRRMTYLYVGKDAFLAHPILGSGPGSFSSVYARTMLARQFQQEGRSNMRAAHNAYLEILVGTGLVGMLLFAVIVLVAFRNFYLARKHFRKCGNTAMYSLTSAYNIAFTSLIIIFFTLSDNYSKYFWMTLAISQIAVSMSRKNGDGLSNT